MKIIEQSYDILKIDEDAYKQIERAARTCYKSEDRITDTSAEKLVSALVDRGHTAMIEFADMTVKFITDRGVTHEFVRHRMASYAQESTRYVKYNHYDMEFVRPVYWEKGSYMYERWQQAMFRAAQDYTYMLEDGAKPQEARAVLPNSIKTEIVVKTNFREWMHIFNLRCSHVAHPQIRELLKGLYSEMNKKYPIIFRV